MSGKPNLALGADGSAWGKMKKKEWTLEEAKEYVDNMILFPTKSSNDIVAKEYGFVDMKDEDVFVRQLTLPV